MNTLDGGMSLHTHRALANIAPSLGIDPPEWMFAAVCASTDPEVFYPDKGGSTAPAKRICEGCPAIIECLAYALDSEERYGVWGGKSERERRRLVQARGGRSGGPRAGTGRGGDWFCGKNGCPYRGASRAALRQHYSRHHPGTLEPVDCPDCGQSVSRRGLGAHRSRAHGIRRGAA